MKRMCTIVQHSSSWNVGRMKAMFFSIIKLAPRVTESTVYISLDLSPPAPCTSIICDGMFGAHCVINKNGMASFWKFQGERFKVFIIVCYAIVR